MPVAATPASPPSPTVRTNLSYLVPICLVATLGGLLFGYDTGVISGAIEPLTARFALGDFMKGWASGCVLIGCAAGVLLVGPISDRFGRRLAMFLAAVMFLASAIGTALPSEIWTIHRVPLHRRRGHRHRLHLDADVYRGDHAGAHARADGGGEPDRHRRRHRGDVVHQLLHRPRKGDPAQPENQAWLINTGWRWMFATGVAPAVLFGLLLIPIPESPRWLIETRRDDRAAEILGKVGGPAFAAAEFASIKAAISQEQGNVGRAFLRASCDGHCSSAFALAMLQQVTGINVFLYFGATIFKTMSASTGVDAGLLSKSSSTAPACSSR